MKPPPLPICAKTGGDVPRNDLCLDAVARRLARVLNPLMPRLHSRVRLGLKPKDRDKHRNVARGLRLGAERGRCCASSGASRRRQPYGK